MKTDRPQSTFEKFNNHFSSLGWIAYESTDIVLIEKCVKLAEKEDILGAEELLTEHFTSIELEWLQQKFGALSEFSKKYKVIEIAHQDNLEGRHAICDPMLRFLLDAILSDIEKRHKKLYTVETTVKEWNDIKTQSTELEELHGIFNATRRKGVWDYPEPEENFTESEIEAMLAADEVFLPYNRGNVGLPPKFGLFQFKYKAAKSWATLIVLFDHLKKWNK